MIDLFPARSYHNTDLDSMDNKIVNCLAFSFKSLVQSLINFISWCIFRSF